MEQATPSQAVAEPGNTGQMLEASSAPTLASAVPAPATAPFPPASASAVPAPASASVSAPEPVAAPTVREDQVQNAVGFLSHPQVRGSTNTASKRAFLERKGLNAAEIDEAFRRVPEAPPQPAAAPVAPPPPTAAPAAAPQSAAYAPPPVPQGQQLMPQQQSYAAAVTPPGTQLVAMQPAGPATLVPQVPPSYRWSQVVLGVGAVVAAGWAVHQLVLPRLRALLDSWQAQRREAEEARHKELHTAVASLKGCQEELRMSTQALLEAVNIMREQQRASTVDGVLPTRGTVAGRPAGAPPRENYYQSVSGRNEPPYGVPGSGNANVTLGAENYAALRAAAGYTNAYPPDPPSYTVSYNYGRGGDSGPATAGPTGGDGGSRTGASMYGASNPPYGAVRSAAANPYGGPVGQQQQQQENLPYRVTAPPSPAHSTHSLQLGRPQQQPMGGLSSASGPYGSNDRLYDSSMPGGAAAPGAQANKAGAPAAAAAAAAAGSDGRTVPLPPPEQPVYPQSFHEVMEMVQKGITPPNVRTDINDSPPDPTQPFSDARLPAPLKPWERAAAAGGSGAGTGAGAGLPAGATPAGRAIGMPYTWDAASSGQSPAVGSPPLQLPPTSYSAPSSGVATGGAAGASGSAAAGSASASNAGRVSSSGAGGSSSGGLTVLPPANPLWRPPPPPLRTVMSSNPASPPSTSQTGTGGNVGEAAAPATAAAPAAHAAPAAPAAAPAAALVADVPEPMGALAGPPSPSPSQPAFAASATELPRSLGGPSESASGAAAGSGPGASGAGTSSAASLSPPSALPPPPPALAAVIGSGDGAAGAAPNASDAAAPAASAVPTITTP